VSEPFIGEIRAFAFGFVPVDWLPCDGRTLPISDNPTLYSVIGNVFGGDGRTTFALPDLRGRVAVQPQSDDGQRIVIACGQYGGEEQHSLTAGEVPGHSHQLQAVKETGNSGQVAGNLWAAGAIEKNLYGDLSSPPSAQMNAAAVGNQGGGAGHPNMQPYLAVNYCIAAYGVFPSRS
jgi:microcystin-dependent protein